IRRVYLDPSLWNGVPQKGSAAKIGDIPDVLSRSESMRDLADLPLGISIDQQISLRVEKDRSAYFLRPVVKMGDPAQRCLDAAKNDRDIFVSFMGSLCVDEDGAIGSLAS